MSGIKRDLNDPIVKGATVFDQPAAGSLTFGPSPSLFAGSSGAPISPTGGPTAIPLYNTKDEIYDPIEGSRYRYGDVFRGIATGAGGYVFPNLVDYGTIPSDLIRDEMAETELIRDFIEIFGPELDGKGEAVGEWFKVLQRYIEGEITQEDIKETDVGVLSELPGWDDYFKGIVGEETETVSTDDGTTTDDNYLDEFCSTNPSDFDCQGYVFKDGKYIENGVIYNSDGTLVNDTDIFTDTTSNVGTVFSDILTSVFDRDTIKPEVILPTDTVTGGDGNDKLDDTVTGGDGNDTVDSGNGTDTVDSGNGNDTVTGGNGNDTVTGGNGNDTVTGGNGNDTVTGGGGNDNISVVGPVINDVVDIFTGDGSDPLDLKEEEKEPQPKSRQVSKSMFQPFYMDLNYDPYQLTPLSFEQKDYMQELTGIIQRNSRGMLT
jgi:hypothetical protein